MNISADFNAASVNHDRLGFAACLALALHAAVILGVSFNREDHTQAATKLEVTLAQHRTSKAMDDADFLAQYSQEGSGTLKEKALMTTREQADFQDTQIREVTPPPQQQQQRNQQSRQTDLVLTTTARSRFQVPLPRDAKAEQEEQSREDELTILQRSLEIASLEAKLDIQRQAYAKRPRIRRLTSVATKQAEDALYIHNWRTKIEAIGNQNYPEEARRRGLYGDLRLLVSLLPNGEVFEVKVLESSGHKLLDQAAIRIVHLASPYQAFPPEMRVKVDILEIIRTWRFQKEGLTSSS